MFSVVLNSLLASLPIFVFFAIGYVLRRQGVVKPQDDGVMMSLAVDVAYPCLVFYNIMRTMVVEANPVVSSFSFSLSAIGCGFLELAAGVLAAYLIAKLLRLKVGTGLRTFSVTSGMQNYAFFVIPVVQMLFTAPDDPTLGVLFVHNMGCEIFVWSAAVLLIGGGALPLKSLLRGPLIAMVSSLLLAWSGLGAYLTVPPVMKTAEMLGAVATPLCLIIFGCSMFDLCKDFKWQPRLLVSGLLARLVLAPAFILLLAWALPVDPLIKRIMVIQSAIPCAVISVVLAKRFGGKPEMATQILLSTTVCSFLTLPIWLTLGDFLVCPIMGD